MAAIPFVGPTYNLDSRPASVQRTVNLMPVPIEPGNERTAWVLKDVPGLAVFGAAPSELPWILLSNFESPDNGTSVTDESVTGNDPTVYSDTYDEPLTGVTSVRAKFGSQSWGELYSRTASFANRILLYQQVDEYELPGEFTLVYWVWPDGTFSSAYPDVYCAASILDFSANPVVQWGTSLLSGKLYTYIANVGHHQSGGINFVAPGQWNLIEVSRQINGDGSATLRNFINGVKVLEEACSNATLSAQQVSISGFVKNGVLPNIYAGGGADPKCYDSIGLLKGLVLHTADYTPPTVPFTRRMTLAQARGEA